MIGPGGGRWWTTREAVDRLQVSADRLRDWVRRSKQAGHAVVAVAGPGGCPACPAGPDDFPHVDPPVRRGGLAAYQAEQLLAAEAYTARGTRGGRLREGA